MFASTNLVRELGIVLFGWQFAAAEFVGGAIMIVLLAVLGGLRSGSGDGPSLRPAERLEAESISGPEHGPEETTKLQQEPWGMKPRSKGWLGERCHLYRGRPHHARHHAPTFGASALSCSRHLLNSPPHAPFGRHATRPSGRPSLPTGTATSQRLHCSNAAGHFRQPARLCDYPCGQLGVVVTTCRGHRCKRRKGMRSRATLVESFFDEPSRQGLRNLDLASVLSASHRPEDVAW